MDMFRLFEQITGLLNEQRPEVEPCVVYRQPAVKRPAALELKIAVSQIVLCDVNVLFDGFLGAVMLNQIALREFCVGGEQRCLTVQRGVLSYGILVVLEHEAFGLILSVGCCELILVAIGKGKASKPSPGQCARFSWNSRDPVFSRV